MEHQLARALGGQSVFPWCRWWWKQRWSLHHHHGCGGHRTHDEGRQLVHAAELGGHLPSFDICPPEPGYHADSEPVHRPCHHRLGMPGGNHCHLCGGVDGHANSALHALCHRGSWATRPAPTGAPVPTNGPIVLPCYDGVKRHYIKEQDAYITLGQYPPSHVTTLDPNCGAQRRPFASKPTRPRALRWDAPSLLEKERGRPLAQHCPLTRPGMASWSGKTARKAMTTTITVTVSQPASSGYST